MMSAFEVVTPPSLNGTTDSEVNIPPDPNDAVPPETLVLPGGQTVLLDVADVERVRSYAWRWNKGIGVTADIDGRSVLLHRWLLRIVDPNQVVAFMDGNKLNVTRANMQVVDRRHAGRKGAAVARLRAARDAVPKVVAPPVAAAPAVSDTTPESGLAGALLADLHVRAYRITTLTVEFEDGSGLGQLTVDVADPQAFVLAGELEPRVRNALTAAVYGIVERYAVGHQAAPPSEGETTG